MNLKTLVGWCLAATILAACSGGAGSVVPSHTSTTTNSGGGSPSITQGVTLKIDAPINLGPSNSKRRSPKFIGAGVDTITYSFTPGPVAGSFSWNSGTMTFSGAAGACTTNYPATPYTFQCPVTLAPGTYSLALTLSQGATVLGTGNAGGILVSPGQSTPTAVNVNPITAGPALSIQGAPSPPYLNTTQFYNDNNPQAVELTANELDPAGDIITTFYGQVGVGIYPTLSFTDAGGTTGVSLPPNISFAAPPYAPTAQGGNIDQTLTYQGYGSATSLSVMLNDGTTTQSVTLPYVSLSNNGGDLVGLNGTSPFGSQISLGGLGSSNAQAVVVTETTTASSGGLDTAFTSSEPVGEGANVNTTSTTTITGGLGAQPMTLNSVANIAVGEWLVLDSGNPNQESVFVTNLSGNQVTVTPLQTHNAGFTVQGTPAVSCAGNAVVATTPGGADAIGTNNTSVAGSNSSVTYYVSALNVNISECILNITSQNDTNLYNSVLVTFPAGLGVGVTSHRRH